MRTLEKVLDKLNTAYMKESVDTNHLKIRMNNFVYDLRMSVDTLTPYVGMKEDFLVQIKLVLSRKGKSAIAWASESNSENSRIINMFTKWYWQAVKNENAAADDIREELKEIFDN